MTNDERKRQRELFEAWAARAMFDSPLLNPLATNTSGDCYLWPVAQNKWNAWQACCEANGVGEPSRPDTPVEQWGDGPPPTLNDCLSLLSSYIADAMPAEAVPDDEYFAAWERLARPVLAKLYAALGTREDGE